MSLLILHLSDIHVRGASDPVLARADDIARCLYSKLPEADAVLILITGDIANTGAESEYNAALPFLAQIEESIRVERTGIDVIVISCPGNHDCDFSLDASTRQMVLESLENNASAVVDDDVIATVTKVQAPYFEFERKVMSSNVDVTGDSLWKVYRFNVDDSVVAVDALNVAWCSRKREKLGALVFPFERYKNSLKESVDFRLTMLHHPPNWFSQAMYKPFRQFLRSIGDVVMSGHEHIGAMGENIDTGTGASTYLEGCVLQGERDLSDSSFFVVEFDLVGKLFRGTQYRWDGERYSDQGTDAWAEFRPLSIKQRRAHAISPSFQAVISDPGGAFTSLKGHLFKLSDVFVYPDLQEVNDETKLRRLFSSQVLKNPDRTCDGVLLKGEEKAGLTSLFYMLFDSYHEQGFVPVYLSGLDLRDPSGQEVQKAVLRAVEYQYGESASRSFEQIERATKVLLLDDFDRGSLKSIANRLKALEALRARFGHVVVGVSSLFSLRDHAKADTNGVLDPFASFTILPFGYQRRTELVRRWIQLSDPDCEDGEDEVTSKCRNAERVLDMVMLKTVVPALPLYMLTVLQSLSAGATGGLQDSGLGQYYGFLLNKGLQDAGIPKSRWEAVLEYCSHLAWLFHTEGQKELSISRLEAFNREFEAENYYVARPNLFDELVKARVLARSGDYLRVRYPYIYYYLKGRYLSLRLSDSAVRAYVSHASQHLYVRHNANTILFLAHHAHDNDFFVDCIVSAMKAPFESVSEIRLDGKEDQPLGTFFKEIPKLVYDGASPEAHQDRTNKARDTVPPSDGLVETEESGGVLSFIAQFVSMLKTVEILGQLLKNQFSSYPRRRRVELLTTLLKGPLRGLNAYISEFIAYKDDLVRDLIPLLRDKGKLDSLEDCEKAAQHFLANVVQATAFGVLLRASIGVSSDDLIDDIGSATANIDSPAARLIRLGVLLDSPKALPQPEIEQLIKETKSSALGRHALAMFSLHRLYMFRSSERERQWLGSQGLIGLKEQNAAAFNARNKRMLK